MKQRQNHIAVPEASSAAGAAGFDRTRLKWKEVDVVPVGKGILNISRDLRDQPNHASGLRKDSGTGIRGIFLGALRLHNYLFVDGFIEREVNCLLGRYYARGQAFLEVGCGDMSINRFLPRDAWYNAFDLSLSERNLERLFAARERANVAMASAKQIPLDSGAVDCLVSSECLEHIPGVDEAVREMRRICRTGAKAIITIPNNFGKKYQVKGPHPEHVNDWTFDGFCELMAACGFRKLEGYMKGYWLPLPTALTRVSYQVSLASVKEANNTNFFFVFEAV